MADDTDDSKKSARPGEAPAAKRPFATIDLKATELPGTGQSASEGAAKPGGATPDPKPSSPGAGASGSRDAKDGTRTGARKITSVLAARAQSWTLLTHVAAGAIGAFIALAVTFALAPEQAPRPAAAPEVGELSRRVAELEGVLGTRPGAAGLRARVDEMSRSVAALGNTQAKLARDAKELEDKLGSGKDAPSELASRIAKLEQAMAAAPMPSDQSGGQVSAPSAALGSRLAELEKAAQEASNTAKSATTRVTADLSAIRTEAGRLSQRLDGIKGEVEERIQGAAKAADFAQVARRISALEQELQGLSKTDAGRRADAGRIVLSLELAALRRALDRGDSYTAELAAVKSAAGDTMNLAPLERYMREGVSPTRELEKSFRTVANAMLDAEADRSDASLFDRLVSSARSIVRVRKVGQTAEDASAEAVIGRMEAALKEGRLAEVIEQVKRLPPKAALASEDWVKRVEARYAVDRTMAEIESALKASLGTARTGGPEPQR
jgi:chromosome segregation ATPase